MFYSRWSVSINCQHFPYNKRMSSKLNNFALLFPIWHFPSITSQDPFPQVIPPSVYYNLVVFILNNLDIFQLQTVVSRCHRILYKLYAKIWYIIEIYIWYRNIKDINKCLAYAWSNWSNNYFLFFIISLHWPINCIGYCIYTIPANVLITYISELLPPLPIAYSPSNWKKKISLIIEDERSLVVSMSTAKERREKN